LVSLWLTPPRSVVTWKRPRGTVLLCATSVAWPSTLSLNHVALSSIMLLNPIFVPQAALMATTRCSS